MRTEQVRITTDASGAGTAQTRHPVSGEICQILVGGTSTWGTGVLNVDRTNDLGNTKIASALPLAGTLFPLPRPVVDGYVRVRVSGGGSQKTDTVRIYWEGE
jgi:hypothetical protein